MSPNWGSHQKSAGEHFTSEHNKAASLYKSACDIVHISPDNFMEG